MKVEAESSAEERRKDRPMIIMRAAQALVMLFVFSFFLVLLGLEVASGRPPNPWMLVLVLAGLGLVLWILHGMATWFHESRHPGAVVERFWRNFKAGKRLLEISHAGLAGHYRDGFFYVSLWDMAGFHVSPRVVLSIRNGERFIRGGETDADGSLSEEDRLELEFLRRLKSEQPGKFQDVVDLLDGN